MAGQHSQLSSRLSHVNNSWRPCEYSITNCSRRQCIHSIRIRVLSCPPFGYGFCIRIRIRIHIRIRIRI